MLENVHPLGFLESHRAQDAMLRIGEADRIVSALGPTDINLTPALEALSAAKALYAAEAYSKALAQAKRAATLASSLNERFTAYMAAWRAVQECRQALEEIGFPTHTIEAALAAADKETVRQVEEAGTLVPNYLGATALLEDATVEARRLVALAREASHDVFLATLAVESLSDSPSRQMPSWLAIRLEGLVERATQELAQGNLPEARRIASEARVRADGARAGASRAWEVLDLTAAMLDGLEASGPLADDLSEKVRSTRAALARGFLDRTTAIALARRVSADVAAFAKHYPGLQTVLERREVEVAVLRMEGFRSIAVEAELSRARGALGRGDWAVVEGCLAIVASAIAGDQKERERITYAVEEIAQRAELLESFRLPMIPGVLELLARSRGEVRGWMLNEAREDLELADALMEQATRTGS